jgi:hypothetical protein
MSTGSQLVAPLVALAQPFTDDVRRQASRLTIPVRDLELQLLLHLPGWIGQGTPDGAPSGDLTARLAKETACLIEPYRSLLTPPADPPTSPLETPLVVVDEEEARIIFENFHYLRSFRQESTHLGLRLPGGGRLMALLTLSDFDLPGIGEALPEAIHPAEIAVVSRIYSFEWAPANTLSHLLAGASKWAKQARPDTKTLLTYVDPNMGFTGASYRAANWIRVGREWGTRYAYLDGHFVTERALTAHFGTADPLTLSRRLGDRLRLSNIDLLPLSVYGHLVTKRLRAWFPNDLDLDFVRR